MKENKRASSKTNLRSSSGHLSPVLDSTRFTNHPRNINDGLQTQRTFDKLPDKSKQEVLLNFVQNKSVLRSLYDLMFSQKHAKSGNSPLTKTHSSAIDFNRLLLHHQKDAQLLAKMPSLANNERYRRNGSGILSTHNLRRSMRRRDSNTIEEAA